MVLVEDGPGPADVPVVGGRPVPGEVGHPLEVRAQHRRLRRHGLHARQALELPLALLGRLGGQAAPLQLLLQLAGAGGIVALLAQLPLDLLHLLGEEVVLLALLQPSADLVCDFLLEAEHLGLGGHDGRAALQAQGRVLHGQQLQLALVFQGEVAGDEVHQRVGCLCRLHGDRRLCGDLVRKLVVARELRQGGPHERRQARGHLGCLADGRHEHAQRFRGRRVLLDGRPFHAFHEEADLAVGELHHLQDPRDGPRAVHVLLVRLLRALLSLGHEEQRLSQPGGLLDAGHRPAAAHEEGHHHAREHHEVLQRDHEQLVLLQEYLHGEGIRPTSSARRGVPRASPRWSRTAR